MKFGLKPKHWKIIEELVLGPLQIANAQVFIFGSRARGDYKEFSDIDFLIKGNIAPSLISKIHEDLVDSDLPIKVDLVLENSIAESYRENILKDCVQI